jgi:alpha-L-fucosidase
LGAVYTLVETDINFEDSNSYYKYKVETSTDNATWTTTADLTANTTRRGGTMTEACKVQARYVRVTINGISNAAESGCLREVLVRGNTPAADAGTTVR